MCHKLYRKGAIHGTDLGGHAAIIKELDRAILWRPCGGQAAEQRVLAD